MKVSDRINSGAEEIERELEERYMPLPTDADGVPVRIGDMMCGTLPSGDYVCGKVIAIGNGAFWLNNVGLSLKPDYMHHHHKKPTVESVLMECCGKYHALMDAKIAEGTSEISRELPTTSELIASFADKLQLKEDE